MHESACGRVMGGKRGITPYVSGFAVNLTARPETAPSKKSLKDMVLPVGIEPTTSPLTKGRHQPQTGRNAGARCRWWPERSAN